MTDKITAALQQALDALVKTHYRIIDAGLLDQQLLNENFTAATAIRAALAAPQRLPAGCTKVELTAEQEAGLTCRASHIPGLAAPQPVQQTQKMTSNCMECANADSWGLPDKAVCATCEWGSRWTPLNKSSVNPNKVQEAPQPAQEAVQVWCDTCVGSGIVHQEPQRGCHVGGDYPCPDCDGNGFVLRHYTTPQAPQRQPLSGIQKAAIGRKHFGNPIPKEWYTAASDLEAAHGITKGPEA